ncbi:zinc finger protein Noc-like [Tachypleus tridentatus]|uniref:zinc finger protein Noc-like n=1 Tax=Tachypleus tridentatus TaxID=6853 RepID=UPI003FD65EBA
MLTSGSHHYIRPEYLSPLPTTLDAKNSPLALLAQTCSQIGADNPNNKPLISGLEKTKETDKAKEKSSFVNDKTSFKPYETSAKKEKNESTEKRSSPGKSSTPIASETTRSNPTKSSCGKISPCVTEDINNSSPKYEQEGTSSSSIATPTSSHSSSGSASAISQNTLSGLGYGTGGTLHAMDMGCSDSTPKDLLGSFPGINPFGAYKPGINPLASCVGCTPMFAHIPVDVASSAHTYPASAVTQSGATPMKPSMFTLNGGMPPYVGYTRVKTPGSVTSFMPLCRDPSCINCQFSLQSAQLSQCPSGCSQCNHDRLPGMGLAGLVPGLSGSASPSTATNLYPHSVMPRPNICSWMIGDNFCGKRFNSSEELLQHLRTHTSLSGGDTTSSLSLFSANLNGPCHHHYSSPTTPTGVRRSYPTSLSPVSNRFHPYKPPLPTVPGAPLPQVPYPGLGLYYPPYSFYGQRLGPPVHP